MPIEIEISLRIPNPPARSIGANGYPVNHEDVRFRKRIVVPSLPKPGELLELETRVGTRIRWEVTRSDWSDRDGLFVLACRYAGRGMSAEERSAVTGDADWKMTPLI